MMGVLNFTLGNSDQRRPYEPKYPTKDLGLNQWTWDMRHDGLHCIDDIKIFAGFGGASVVPGRYAARVSIGGAESMAELDLVPDPRIDASAEHYAFLAEKLREVTDLLNELLYTLEAVRKTHAQTRALMADYPDAEELKEFGQSAIARLTAWEHKVTQTKYETYEDEDALPPRLDVHIRHVLDVIDRASAPVSTGSIERLADISAEWRERKAELQAIVSSDIAAVNAWARMNGVPHVAAPAE